MKKRIQLETNSGRLLDREPFLMAENETLEIEILSDYNVLFIVSMKNGQLQAQITSNGTFTVPVKLISDGMLEIVISVYFGEEVSRCWHVEPIRIIRHDSKFVWHPILDEINTRLDCVGIMEEHLRELDERLYKTEQTINDVAEIIYDPLN